MFGPERDVELVQKTSESRPCSRRIAIKRWEALALIFYILLTLVMTLPLPGQLNKAVAGWSADVYLKLWADWWTEKALGEGKFTHDTIFVPYEQNGEQIGQDFIALPNPLRERERHVLLMCRTRCVGNALVNIYDAVGTMLFRKVVKLQQPDAVGYKMCVPWDCRNQQGRQVGDGTYLAVVRIYDTGNRLVARRTTRIGVARID